MANTYVDYTAVASQTDYNFSFEYLRDDHVKVKVNDVIVTNYTIVTSPVQLIRFTDAPLAGYTIKIYRDSRGDFSPLVDFVNGSVLTESELDESYKHNLFVSQESSEGTGGEQLTKKGLTDYDAEGNKIINLGTPTANTDAANKAYTDQAIDNAIALGGSPAIVSLGAYDVTAFGTGEARTLANRFADVVNVKDYGAKGDYNDSTGTGTDDTVAIQAAINACENGVLYFPEGHYKVTDTITIQDKNDQNDWTQGQFRISAYGAMLWSTADGLTPIVHIVRCKQLHIQGLRLKSISGSSPTYATSVQGMWKSTWEDCFMGVTEFGRGASQPGSFDSHYWNVFKNCSFSALHFFTNTTSDRHEFNQNLFISCTIHSHNRDYSIYKYGSQGIQDLRFISCDISYYDVGILYIDEETSGMIQIDSGYFDSAGTGIPKDTKGITVDVTGSIATPNSANTDTYWLSGNGSKATSRGQLGARDGQRDPTSTFNFIKNGSMRAAGSPGTGTNNIVVTDVAGGEGYYSNYKNFAPTADGANVQFNSVAVPYSGTYTMTVISRQTGTGDSWINKVTVNGGGDTFGVIESELDEWTVSSYNIYLTKGDLFVCRFDHNTAGTAPRDLEVAYAGLTLGAVGTLSSIEVPEADYYNPTQVEGGFDALTVNSLTNVNGVSTFGGNLREEYVTMTYTPSVASQDILFVGISGHESFEVDVVIRDSSFPNGVLKQKLYVVCRGSGTTVTAVAYTQENKARIAADPAFTDYPTWTAAVSGTNIMLSCTSNSGTSGASSLSMLVRGTHSSITPQL